MISLNHRLSLLPKVERSSDFNTDSNMHQIRFNYSLKKIKLPTKNSYLNHLITKTNNFIERMRWKANFFSARKQQQHIRTAHKSGGNQIAKSGSGQTCNSELRLDLVLKQYLMRKKI